MKLAGILLALAGWMMPVLALTFTQSMAVRFILAVLGILLCLIGILGVLNNAHLKHAIWKK